MVWWIVPICQTKNPALIAEPIRFIVVLDGLVFKQGNNAMVEKIVRMEVTKEDAVCIITAFV